MTVAEMLGTPVSDPAESIRAPSDRCPLPTPQQPDVDAKRRSGGPLRTALIAASTVCLGIVLGARAIPRTGDPFLTPSPAAVLTAVPAGIAGFAELFVATHLSGVAAPEDLVALYPDATSSSAARGLWINRAATITGVLVEEDTWRLTVAADVLEMVDGAYEPTGIQHFTVTIAQTNAQPVAVTAPSRIPPPEVVWHPIAAAQFTRVVPPDQEIAVTGFLSAYLTGQGEVARYIAPTARIALFSTPPYVSAEIRSMGADSQGRVRARLTAVSATGATQALEYTLDMTHESGVWEVLTLASADARS